MVQSRRFGDVQATSALPPKADIHRAVRHVRLVSRRDSCGAANCTAFRSPDLRAIRTIRGAISQALWSTTSAQFLLGVAAVLEQSLFRGSSSAEPARSRAT